MLQHKSCQSTKQVQGKLPDIQSKTLNNLVTINIPSKILANIPIIRLLPQIHSVLVLKDITLNQLKGSDIYIYNVD